jgi:uncharacterized membrane protein
MPVTTAPLFSARLTPHRSMSRKGMRRVMALTALLALIPGLFVFSFGAWPVVVFMALDIIAIAWAFHASLEDGKRRELVTVWSDRIELLATSPKGAETRTRFNPLHVKLIVERDYDEHTTALKLRTALGDTEIGDFLTGEEKASFARALGTALRKARVRQPASKSGRGA